MSRQSLVIDSCKAGYFFLLVDNGVVTLATSAASDFLIRDLHVSRIHCEIEVDDDQVCICGSSNSSSSSKSCCGSMVPGGRDSTPLSR